VVLEYTFVRVDIVKMEDWDTGNASRACRCVGMVPQREPLFDHLRESETIALTWRGNSIAPYRSMPLRSKRKRQAQRFHRGGYRRNEHSSSAVVLNPLDACRLNSPARQKPSLLFQLAIGATAYYLLAGPVTTLESLQWTEASTVLQSPTLTKEAQQGLVCAVRKR
jgi:hypothetical protein